MCDKIISNEKIIQITRRVKLSSRSIWLSPTVRRRKRRRRGVAALCSSAHGLPDWKITRHAYCGEESKPQAAVTWGLTFDACVAACVQKNTGEFAFTNEKWNGPAGRKTACACTTPCAKPLTSGSNANFDTYDCPQGPCNPPKPPPPPVSTCPAARR